jgi:chaperonin GroES
MLRPIKSNIIVKLIEKEKVTASGIVLANPDRDEVDRGEVIAIGPKCQDVKVGQIILANWNAAAKTKMDEEEFWIVPEEEVVLIFEGEE